MRRALGVVVVLFLCSTRVAVGGLTFSIDYDESTDYDVDTGTGMFDVTVDFDQTVTFRAYDVSYDFSNLNLTTGASITGVTPLAGFSQTFGGTPLPAAVKDGPTKPDLLFAFSLPIMSAPVTFNDGDTAVLGTFSFAFDAGFSVGDSFQTALNVDRSSGLTTAFSTKIVPTTSPESDGYPMNIPDPITLRAVPEPSSFAAVGLVLFGIGFTARIRRKSLKSVCNLNQSK